jgi:hypothetical protein
MSRIAVKRLTASDLTLFEWHFHNRNAGNQKSINLNANVFISQLYPYLQSTDAGRAGLVHVDLHLYGPGESRDYRVARKIIKGGSYKNWRLNGEYITNPHDSPARFNALVPGDFAIFDFEGELFPTSARVVFVARTVAEDASLHQGLVDAGLGSMAALALARLRLIVHAAGVPESHPVYELLLDSAIEDAAQGGADGIRKLLTRQTGRRMTRQELERARQRADDIGRMGEELIDGFFAGEVEAGRVQEYEWVSNENAIAPFDFRLGSGVGEKVEVKSTCGGFSQVLHISVGQLVEMQRDEPYSLYRVYALDEHRAKLRIATGLRQFAETVLHQLSGLPNGVEVDSVSVRPDSLPFGEEVTIDLTPAEDTAGQE